METEKNETEKKATGLEGLLDFSLGPSLGPLTNAPFILGIASAYSASDSIRNLDAIYMGGVIGGLAAITAFCTIKPAFTYYRENHTSDGIAPALLYTFIAATFFGVGVFLRPMLYSLAGHAVGNYAKHVLQ